MTQRRNFLSTMGVASAALASAQTTSRGQTAPPSTTTNATLDIFQAAFRGDAARVAELAKQNPAIARLRSSDGRTPLHYAVEGGQAGMIVTLTMLGADLSAGPESPLLTAVNYRDHAVAMEMSHALLMNGSDPNAKMAGGVSALELAAKRGYSDIVELLVHRGAEGSQADAIHVERVHFAMRYRFDIAGRPYEAENIDGLPQDFINDCVRQAHFDVERVKHLMKIAPGLIGARATWDELAIEAAAHMGLVPLARHLADLGAPVSTCTVALLGLLDLVETLVKTDAACVRERGAHDIALLVYTAFGEQRSEIADTLLRAGADVEGKSFGGATTLHIAASKGYVELADVLIAHGANVNAIAPSRGGAATPLQLAEKAQQTKMVELLRARGARS